MGFFILVELLDFMHRNGEEIRRCRPLFSSNKSKAIELFHLFSIADIFSIVFVFRLDMSVFLLIQLLILVSLWRTNRMFKMGENIRRISFIYTVIYISYILVTTKNVPIGYAILPYMDSWLYLQLILDMPRGRET